MPAPEVVPPAAGDTPKAATSAATITPAIKGARRLLVLLI